MELLGEILHFSKSGRLIVRIDNYKTSIKSGLNISDDQNKKIGKISELLGPFIHPMPRLSLIFRKETNWLEQKYTLMKIIKKIIEQKRMIQK